LFFVTDDYFLNGDLESLYCDLESL